MLGHDIAMNTYISTNVHVVYQNVKTQFYYVSMYVHTLKTIEIIIEDFQNREGQTLEPERYGWGGLP